MRPGQSQFHVGFVVSVRIRMPRNEESHIRRLKFQTAGDDVQQSIGFRTDRIAATIEEHILLRNNPKNGNIGRKIGKAVFAG